MASMVGLKNIDNKIIITLRRTYIPVARISIFVIFFWFGFIKLTGQSPAGPLAEALVAKTIGIQHFDFLFKLLALMECVIGILFLIPKATRVVIPLLFIHMVIVCSPLFLVPEYTWNGFLIPTLEGQYIIKNLVVIAVAIGIAAQLDPLKSKK